MPIKNAWLSILPTYLLAYIHLPHFLSKATTKASLETAQSKLSSVSNKAPSSPAGIPGMPPNFKPEALAGNILIYE